MSTLVVIDMGVFKGLASLPVAASSGLPGGEACWFDLAEGHGGKPVCCHVYRITRAADPWSFSGVGLEET